EPLANLRDVRRQLWPFEHDRRVNARYEPAAIAHDLTRTREEIQTGRVLPARIRISVVTADVAGGGRTEHRVDHGVAQHVAVGMTVRSSLERHNHTCKYQWTSFDETMEIVTRTDTRRRGHRRARRCQIIGGRDLDVAFVALHHLHRMSCLLS